MITTTHTYDTAAIIAALNTAKFDYDYDGSILADITLDGKQYGLSIDPTKRKVSAYTFTQDEASLTDSTNQALLEWAQTMTA